MKFMIAVDLEGLTCVVGCPGKTLTDSRDFTFACQQAVREVNAAAKALFDMGAARVLVWDNHGGSLHLQYDKLDERCEIVLGSGVSCRWPCVDQTFAGLLMIGYHPMDNTVDGVLAHTYNSAVNQWIKINGEDAGEIEIDAAVAGERFQVPVIFVASDDKGIAEVRKYLPWAGTVTTKIGLGRNMALSKHPLAITNEIYESVKRAVENIKTMKPFTFGSPIEIMQRYKRLEDAEKASRENCVQWDRIDPYTVMQIVNSICDLF